MNPTDFITGLILSKSYTKSQVARRFRLLKEFLQFKLFQTQITDEDQLIEAFLSQTNAQKSDLDWFIDCDKSGLMPITPMQIEEVLKGADAALNNLPVVMVYVPFQIKDEQYFGQSLEQIGQWFKQNLSQGALFEMIYQPSLIGGAAFSAGGVYKDYSLKSKLDKNRAGVIQAINKVKSHEH
jgi:hypothetical protein